MNVPEFENVSLTGGFVIVQVTVTDEDMVDALGRPAIAQTVIVGRRFEMQIRPGLSAVEFSVTLYHETLEAMTVACFDPPESVVDFNEGDFEQAGYGAHAQWGFASPENLNRMLQSYGFRRE